MGDKGRKDKNKHDKQVNKAKDTQNEANRKKQEKTHLQNKGYASIRNITSDKPIPASEVVIVGKVADLDVELLHGVSNGDRITVK